ncbi:phage portal protein [Aminobacter sp. P9b]|uniref:phage portal protein n=1 Tax=Aminobacter sp. P9b TaxID=3133697 RepID=UPI003254CF1D
MNLLRKMADGLIRVLSVRDKEGWVSDAQRGDAGETVTESSVMALSAVWSCVNLLSGTISSLPLMVYRTGKKGAREVAKDHSLYRILHDSPNYDQTALDFWDFICASIELWGNGYAKIERNGGLVAALVPIRPNSMYVRRLQNGDIEYRWTDDGKAYVATDREMLHIRGPGGSPLGGMSTLEFGRNAFSLARAADKSASGMFANGLRPSGVLTFDKFLSAENREIAETKLAQKFVGAVNAGRPMVLEGGTKWEKLTINPDEAQMLESRAFSVEEICRFFNVPPVMIGHTSKTTSWPTGVEQQGLILQKFTLRRRLKRIEQALMKQLLTPADRAAGVTIEFNLEGLLRGDTASRSAFYTAMLNAGVFTINYVRSLENLPPIEGGDVPRMQMQNVPITEAGKETEALPSPDDDEE